MSGDEIVSVDAWEVLDSRGKPTVACRVELADGSAGQAAVPSGASTGKHEAHELRDGGERHGGHGVLTAAQHARGELADAVVGWSATDQRGVDEVLRATDGSPSLSRLGANAVLAVSLATAHAAAAHQGVPLWQHLGERPLIPLPMVNIVSGGAHAGGLIDIQDVLVIPVGATSFAEAIEWCCAVRAATAVEAEDAGVPATLVADEGGIAGRLPSNRAAIELVARGIERARLEPGTEVAIALDVAATEFVDEQGRYHFHTEQRSLDAGELVDEIAAWCRSLPIVSIEDIVGEDDWEGWRYATSTLGHLQLVGDDLFVTQLDRLATGVEQGAANAVLVKLNQNGTLSGGLDVIARCREVGYASVVSARSGETEDHWLADLAVGSRAEQIKVGSTTRSERTAKWNRLLQIERTVGTHAYAGAAALDPGHPR